MQLIGLENAAGEDGVEDSRLKGRVDVLRQRVSLKPWVVAAIQQF